AKAVGFEHAAAGTGVAVTRIGTVRADAAGSVRFLDAAGQDVRFARLSFSHL
ncbi:MAG: thiamine-phosphate kinase, partial [Alphaproteobacteria bacterium]|nr:thiamine-phosphate kinase [Alphaproteobacteria bacterium]